MKTYPDHLRYLKQLAKEFPTRDAAVETIIDLQTQLALPKGTEHFVSDIHGAFDAFCKVVSHASGAIKRKIAEIFKNTLSDREQIHPGALIYDPERKLATIMLKLK